jgi:threonine dehydratase
VITGQGTVALEMLEVCPNLDALIIPIGGGGLLSGMAVAAKALNPKIEIFGVQLQHSSLETFPTIAEGIAVKEPGKLTAEIMKKLVTDIFTIEERAIEQAVENLAIHHKLVVEGAGAVGVAALLNNKSRFKNKRGGIVLSGGNIDARLLSSLLLKRLVYDGKLVRMKINVADVSGSLAMVSQLLESTGAHIIELHHQRLFTNNPIKIISLEAAIEVHGKSHVDTILATLNNAGFSSQLLI